jgi:hypothetical protein
MEKSPGGSSPTKQRIFIIAVGVAIVIGVALFLSVPRQAQDEDRVLREMISQIDESRIYQTAYDLQNVSTRQYPSAGNRRAAEYLHDRLAAMPGPVGMVKLASGLVGALISMSTKIVPLRLQ